jgi:predicted dinucleotide-binding enzyme
MFWKKKKENKEKTKEERIMEELEKKIESGEIDILNVPFSHTMPLLREMGSFNFKVVLDEQGNPTFYIDGKKIKVNDKILKLYSEYLKKEKELNEAFKNLINELKGE